MRFQYGDYVKVRSWKDMENEFGLNSFREIPCDCFFVSDMKYLCGQILSITKVLSRSYLTRSSSGDMLGYNISDDMLELSTYFKEEFEQQESTR